MLDTFADLQERLAHPSEPRACALATVVATDGSVPRPTGASMLVDASGTIRGSLTGGCVEGAVVDACQDALATGVAAVHRFGYSDDDAFAVGLMCGGTVEVLVQPFSPAASAPERIGAASGAAPAPLAMVARLPAESAVEDRTAGASPGAVVLAEQDAAAVQTALAPLVPSEVLGTATVQVGEMVRSGRTGTLRCAPPGGAGEPLDLFVESRTRPAHLIVAGANAFGSALVEAARPLGHRITLCDPRPAFADPAAFPGAEVVRAWPHRFLEEAARTGDLDARSLVCVLTHDPKVDIPTLLRALELDVAYVGAMGSRRSDRDRRAALRAEGAGEEALARLHSPIGLDLGAVTPAEVAIAVLAEILAVRTGHEQAAPLSRGTGPLHPPAGPGDDRS